MQRYFTHAMAFAAGALTTYFQVPYRCTLRGLSGSVDADPGDGETVTVYKDTGSVELGTLTFGSGIAAGAKGTFAANATYGDTVLAAGDLLKIVTSTASAANLTLTIELDPHALKA
jgi:hypothetical protein